MNWVAFYVRYISEYHPLDSELYGYECEGATPQEAIENLEKNPSVPFSIFLVEVVPAEEAGNWVREAETEAKNLQAKFSYQLHS
jgi:hypothetical protein